MNSRKNTVRQTFKRTLRRISIVSVTITMIIAWMLLSATSLIPLKQYAQTNLKLSGTMVSHSLEAAVVFHDKQAANETLTALGNQGLFAQAEVLDHRGQPFANWVLANNADRTIVANTVSRWLYPNPITVEITHNNTPIGTLRLTGTDGIVTHFVWISLAVLTACLTLAAFISMGITHYLHYDLVRALQNITEVVHEVRVKRDFSRRVSPEKIAEFQQFSSDFNSLLGEMEEWQHKLQQRNDYLQKSALHDPLTGLPNRASFNKALQQLMNSASQRQQSALLFMDGDNFKTINDTWGHSAGDQVLMEIASRLVRFVGVRCKAYRLGGDEFAVILTGVQQVADIHYAMAKLHDLMLPAIHIGSGIDVAMTLSVGYAIPDEGSTAESILDVADRRMYSEKRKRLTT